MQVLDVQTRDVGIMNISSDWPAAVTYYVNFEGLK